MLKSAEHPKISLVISLCEPMFGISGIPDSFLIFFLFFGQIFNSAYCSGFTELGTLEIFSVFVVRAVVNGFSFCLDVLISMWSTLDFPLCMKMCCMNKVCLLFLSALSHLDNHSSQLGPTNWEFPASATVNGNQCRFNIVQDKVNLRNTPRMAQCCRLLWKLNNESIKPKNFLHSFKAAWFSFSGIWNSLRCGKSWWECLLRKVFWDGGLNASTLL